MAPIFRRFRHFFGSLRSCITGTNVDQDPEKYKYQDAYYWKEGKNDNVKLICYRMLTDSKEDLQADINNEKETKSKSQISSKSDEIEEPPTHQPKAKNPPFPMITVFSPFQMIPTFYDVVVKIGKGSEFPTTKEVLCKYSAYFYKRLASNKERICVLKVDEKYVNPEAFKTILQFLCFRQPFTCQNLTTEVIRTATYLRMPLIICKIAMILNSRMRSAENALAKLALISEMREQLEKCPPVANLKCNKTQVTVKGQRGNLKDKHLVKMCKLEHIQKEKEWFFEASVEGDKERSTFEEVAMRPHIVVEEAERLTLYAFNVFKHNYKYVVYVDLEDYKKSVEDGLRGCTEFLATKP